MSKLSPPHTEHTTAAADTGRGWAVWRCEQGCIHLAFERVVLTLDKDDLQALVRMLNQAWAQIIEQSSLLASPPRQTH